MFHCGVKVEKRWENLADPAEPHRVPGVLQHQWSLWLLPRAEPSTPAQRMGSSNAGEGSRKAKQGVQRDFYSAASPWTVADPAGAPASHHNMHRQLWCTRPPPCPLLKLPLAATAQSHGAMEGGFC